MKTNKLSSVLQEALEYLKQLPFNPCDNVQERLTGHLVTALTYQQKTK